MASAKQIVHDLRLHANALDGRHMQGTMTDSLCRSLRRGAAEIERLEAELVYLRGFAEERLAAEAAAQEAA